MITLTFIKENIFKSNLTSYNIFFKLFILVISYKAGEIISEFNKLSTVKSVIYKNYDLYFIISALLTSLISIYLINEWFKLWSFNTGRKIKLGLSKQTRIGNKRYTILLLLIILGIYISLVLILSLGKVLYIDLSTIQESFLNILYSTYKLYLSYLIIPFLFIIIYTIKKHSAQLIFNINSAIFFCLSTICIKDSNNIYNMIQMKCHK